MIICSSSRNRVIMTNVNARKYIETLAECCVTFVYRYRLENQRPCGIFIERKNHKLATSSVWGASACGWKYPPDLSTRAIIHTTGTSSCDTFGIADCDGKAVGKALNEGAGYCWEATWIHDGL